MQYASLKRVDFWVNQTLIGTTGGRCMHCKNKGLRKYSLSSSTAVVLSLGHAWESPGELQKSDEESRP